MKMLGTQTILGLAVDDFAIFVAELSVRSGRPEIRRTGLFEFDEKLDPDNMEQAGRKLRHFLRTNHFVSKRAIVGIPTKWIVAKEIVTPPATADALTEMLAIQAERAFSLNANDLIFDYCGHAGTSEKSRVMLMAARRQIVDQIKKLGEAAGLQLQAVTVSALAFGKALGAAGSQRRYGIYARPNYCEFWSQSRGSLQSIKHVPMEDTNGTAAERAELLTSTIQRLILLSSNQNQSPPYDVTVYDASSPADGVIERLSKQLSPRIKVSDGRTSLLKHTLSTPDQPEDARAIAAAALTMTSVAPDRPSVDFLNPRIGRRRTSPRKRIITWAAVAGVLSLLILGAVVADWQIKSAQIKTYTRQLDLMSEEITDAREMIDRIAFAGSWISRKPEFLECMRQLTLAFPELPRVWATSLALSENAEGSLVGRAVDERSFYEVLDKIKQNRAFSDVMMMHLRDAGGNSREKEFAVTLKFEGLK